MSKVWYWFWLLDCGSGDFGRGQGTGAGDGGRGGRDRLWQGGAEPFIFDNCSCLSCLAVVRIQTVIAATDIVQGNFAAPWPLFALTFSGATYCSRLTKFSIGTFSEPFAEPFALTCVVGGMNVSAAFGGYAGAWIKNSITTTGQF